MGALAIDLIAVGFFLRESDVLEYWKQEYCRHVGGELRYDTLRYDTRGEETIPELYNPRTKTVLRLEVAGLGGSATRHHGCPDELLDITPRHLKSTHTHHDHLLHSEHTFDGLYNYEDVQRPRRMRSQ